MSRSKKVFAFFALAFFVILAYVAYDIGSRTTFPGHRRGGQENLPAVDSSSQKAAPDSLTPRK